MYILRAVWEFFKGLFGQFFDSFLACLWPVLWHV